MVEQIIGQCYECQVTTKQHRQEPVKVTDIPKKPWDVIAVDFDGHYNLVAINKRTKQAKDQKHRSLELDLNETNSDHVILGTMLFKRTPPLTSAVSL